MNREVFSLKKNKEEELAVQMEGIQDIKYFIKDFSDFKEKNFESLNSIKTQNKDINSLYYFNMMKRHFEDKFGSGTNTEKDKKTDSCYCCGRESKSSKLLFIICIIIEMHSYR